MSTNNNTFGTNIELATQNLIAGQLVAFPTETVYGLGADATKLLAVKKVFAAKGRPTDHPLIVHISGIDKIELWAKNISQAALRLAEHFWPGPVTLILEKQDSVLSEITAGQDSVALRVPRHPYALALLRNFSGLVGPSANKYGRISPTRAVHVLEDFDNEVSYVLDGGACEIGIESTIIDCRNDNIKILRQGSILATDIARVLQQPVEDSLSNYSRFGAADSITTDPNVYEHSQANDGSLKENVSNAINCDINIDADNKAELRVPGLKTSHYAPTTPLYVLDIEAIADRLDRLLLQQKKCAVLSFNACPNKYKNSHVAWHKVANNPATFSKLLYKNMRDMDKLNVDELIIEKPADDIAWVAVLDRLSRASARSI